MALMHISMQIFNIETIRGWIYNAFDSVEIVQRYHDRLVLRVQHEELPIDDTWVKPRFMWVPGTGQAILIDFEPDTDLT